MGKHIVHVVRHTSISRFKERYICNANVVFIYYILFFQAFCAKELLGLASGVLSREGDVRFSSKDPSSGLGLLEPWIPDPSDENPSVFIEPESKFAAKMITVQGGGDLGGFVPVFKLQYKAEFDGPWEFVTEPDGVTPKVNIFCDVFK
jgi:hypothetical protein